MHLLPRVFLVSVFLACALALSRPCGPLGAQTADPKGGTETTPKKIPLDKFKVPPGATVILVDEGKDVRGFFPRMVLMSPEKHQELMERIAALEKKEKGDRKTPYQCRMTGTVEGATVRLVAELSLQADQPRSSIIVGFRGTQLAEARVRPRESDNAWQPAVMDLGADGYTVTVDKAGDYVLNLEVRLPLSNGPGGPVPGVERGFEVALPGAAVTTLALELAAAVKEVRWNGTNIEKPAAPGAEQKRWELAVGTVKQLQVSWKEALDSGNPSPLRMVRGQVTVRVEDQQVVTTAELTLTDLRGKAKTWQLWLPPQAVVKVLAPENLAHKWNGINTTPRILTLSQPTTDPIKVQVTLSSLRSAGKVSVGPFFVQDAQRQEGTIEVKVPLEARRSLRLAYHLAGSLEEREVPRDQPGSETVALFKYWDMPLPPKGAKANGAGRMPGAPLELELRAIHGKVEAKVEHNLSLRQTESGWQIAATCKIVARPLDAPVDFLDVQLASEAFPLVMEPSFGGFPAGLPWGTWATATQLPLDGDWVLGSGAASVEMLVAEGSKLQRKIRLKWAQPQSKEFSVTLLGTYTLPVGTQKVRLELPRPLVFHDSAAARMDVPESLELLTQDSGTEVTATGKHASTRMWDRQPVVWDVAWRPYRPEFAVNVVADVTFRPRFAHVKEQLSWDQPERAHGPGGKAAALALKVPPDVKNLKISSGGKLRNLDTSKQLAVVDLTQEALAKTVLVVEYDFVLLAPTAARQDFVVPLVCPEQATQADIRVRLWGPPGTSPLLITSGQPDMTWKDVGLEVVPGRGDLPIRVFQSGGLFAPLTLRLAPAPAALPNVIVERALIQVTVDDEGTEQYRARFLVSRLNSTTIDVRLPIPLKNLDPKFILDGKEVSWRPGDAGGIVAQLELDVGPYARAVVFEVAYQLPRGQSAMGPWQSSWQPPVLDGQVLLGKVLWQVTLPASVLAVSARGEATTEQRWAWRGWLPALVPAVSGSELEQWITGQEGPEGATEASLVSGSNSLEPLRVFRVSRALWLLVCSGIFLLAGLGLYAWPPRPSAGVALLVLFLAALGATGWFWPEILPAVFQGVLPGLALLGALLALQWMVHQRYRRQLVFMPGFKRVKTGSSLLRPNSLNRHREPSTVDVPRPPEKSDPGLKSNA
jgi:hypothetical protein